MLYSSILLLIEQVSRRKTSEDTSNAATGVEPSEVTTPALVSRWPGMVGIVHHAIVERGMIANVHILEQSHN